MRSARVLHKIRDHRTLLVRSVLWEFRTTHAGQKLGGWWVVVGPMLLTAIYSLIYIAIFRVRTDGLNNLQYTGIIVVGLTSFIGMANAMSIGATSVTNNRALWQSSSFPVEFLALRTAFVVSIPPAIGLAVTATMFTVSGSPSAAILLTPLLWFAGFCLSLSLVGIFGVVGAYFRDLAAMMNYIVLILLISSPIAYTMNMVPSNLKFLVFLNPLSYGIFANQFLFLGPSGWDWVLIFCYIAISFLLGFVTLELLSRIRERLADEI